MLEKVDTMSKKMVTFSGLQVWLCKSGRLISSYSFQRTLNQSSNPAIKGAEEGIQHMAPDADSDDPLLNSTPNNQYVTEQHNIINSSLQATTWCSICVPDHYRHAQMLYIV